MLAAGDEPFEISVEEYRQTFVHPDDREWTARLAEAAYCSGEPPSWERRLVRRDGAVIWETSHARFELDEHGRPLRVIGVVQDITDRVAGRGAARVACPNRRGRRARAAAVGARPPRRRPEPAGGDPDQARARREEAGEDPVAARLDELVDDADAAVEELRALGHGIYPTELRDAGLEDGAALARGGGADPCARRRPTRSGGYAPTIEEAVFFCAREAIQNATKHAGAQRTTSTLSLQARRRRASSSSSPTTAPASTRDEQSKGFGLASMRDRIAAVGGELEIDSAPGEGTRIRGSFPASRPR